MTKTTHVPVPTPEKNRLRAAAALIPIIKTGLSDSKISAPRAVLMASFCEWTTEGISDDPYTIKLAQTVEAGLTRVKATLESVGHGSSIEA